MTHLDDTIVAVASPPGGAARGVVRLSGPAAAAVVAQCFHPNDPDALRAVRAPTALAGQLCLGGPFAPLPCDLYLWPGPRSYTGQPAAELHMAGSPPLLSAAVRALCAAGARPAEPGEFTLRAFLAGRMDLTQAEAVLGAIDAADPAALRVALSQLAGGLTAPLQQLRSGLVELLADIEAGLDFADEDIRFVAADELDRRLDAAEAEVAALAARMAGRTEVRDAVAVALVGRPNAGKSRLFNALLGAEAAIVAAQAGTTRDYLVGELDLSGVRCRLIDTAGLESKLRGDAPSHAGTDSAEIAPAQAAQAAAAEQRRQAQVYVVCLDATQPADARVLAAHCGGHAAIQVVALTKCDLGMPRQLPPGAICVSSVTGLGLEELRAAIRRAALEAAAPARESVPATAARCGASLRQAADALAQARRLTADARGEELVAAELRGALDALGQVVGAVYTEELLDSIFSRFCVGK